MPVTAEEPVTRLLELLVRRLADELAPRLAPELAARQLRSNEPAPRSARLVTLDQLTEYLPRGKKPETWKRWLYQRTRRGEVPGCHKIGGRLFFDVEITLSWLETACTPAKLDQPAEQSLHDESVYSGKRDVTS